MQNILPYFLIIITCLCSSCKNDNVDHRSHHHHGKSDGDAKKEYRDSATIKMAAFLADTYSEFNPLHSNYRNGERAAIFLQQRGSTDVNVKFPAMMRGAFELVNAGKNEEALAIYDELLMELSKMNFPEKPGYIVNVKGWRAITNLRIAELENCQNNHNRSSCLMPFQKEAYHKMVRGGEAAIEDLKAVLEIFPDYNMRYLLNFAYMTLGKYPGEVPAKHLMPLSLKERKTNLNRFVNKASEIGIDDNHLSGGVIIDDFNGDGHLDIFCSSWRLRDQIRYYLNRGDGTFKESHLEAGLKGITGGLNMTHADYDNDGDLDVLILRGAWLPLSKFPNSLLRNNGDGSFSDVTRESGIFSSYPTQTNVWADFNNDGLLDLFIGNESVPQMGNYPCELYLNQGDGKFKEIATSVNAAVVGYVKGVTVADYDNDGDQDLFLSIMNGKNKLLRNDLSLEDGSFAFLDVADSAGIGLPMASFPCWFFDYDNNGTEDLFIASYPVEFFNNLAAEYARELLGENLQTEFSRIYKNNGDGTFTDETKTMGFDKAIFAMGSGFGDMNNDGYLDIYIGTGEPDLKAIIPNRAFLNDRGKKYDEVTAQAGLGHVQKGHAVSFVDLDQDGDEDIYTVMGGAYEGDSFFNAYFENPGQGNQSLKVKLKGTTSNSYGLGARVKLKVMKAGKERSIHRTVSSGSSFGENPFELHFGYLTGEEPVSIEVRWPAGGLQKFSDLESGKKRYLIAEGSDQLETSELQTVEFKLTDGHHHHHH